MREFQWTGQKEEAAYLAAEDRLTNREIAARVGVGVPTLIAWKRQPEFRARVESLVAGMAAALRESGIASRERRIEALNDRWCRMLRLIEARAKAMADVPGGETGLLTKRIRLVKVHVSIEDSGNGSTSLTIKPVARGARGPAPTRRFVEVAQYVVDVGLLRELREHEKQAAMELGHWRTPGRPVDLWVMEPDQTPGEPREEPTLALPDADRAEDSASSAE